jgi:hypothetical protein
MRPSTTLTMNRGRPSVRLCTAGVSQNFGGDRHLGALLPRPAAGPGVTRRRGARRSGRMAASRCRPVTATTSYRRRPFAPRVEASPYRTPLHGRVLVQARSRHGTLLGAIGNRDF